MRYLADDACTFDGTIATDTAVSIGDFVIATDTVGIQPVSTQATVAEALAGFAGVALQDKPAGIDQIRGNSRPGRIRIATAGVWEATCTDALEIGDALTFHQGADTVAAQAVAKVAEDEGAIGIALAAKDAGAGVARFRLFVKRMAP
jgi:hypothetical protein